MKRLIDIILAFILGLLLLPLMIMIALIIRFDSEGPAIFWSSRIGKNNALFLMPKFRTMRKNTPVVATELLCEPDKHVTRVGHFLRKTSLDELPQLYSVIFGKMSLVGPRPALASQSELIKRRNFFGVNVLRPGVTGWAQINGRDAISEELKVQMDLEYLERRSIIFDFLIMWKTVSYVLRSKGVSH